MTTETATKGPETKGNDIGLFIARATKLLLRPSTFWQSLGDRPVTVSEVVWPHMVLLVAARAIANMVGAMLGGAGIGTSLTVLFTSFISCFAAVWAFGFAAMTIASMKGGKAGLSDGIVFAGYAVTPMLVFSIVTLIPVKYVQLVADILMLPYAFHVLSLGVGTQLGIPEGRVATAVAQLCGALLVIWQLMPNLLPAIVRAVSG